ncbi:hypothetical protein DXD55_13335, partial [Bacteroides stercoris]
DCNGFTDYRHFNQNPCNSILSLYLSAFHFFVVTLLCSFIYYIHHERIYHRGQSRYNQSRHDVSVEQTERHRLAAGSRQ